MMETAEQLTLFNKSSRLEQWQERLIINNLDKSNREIGQLIARSEAVVRNFLHKQQIRRTDEQIKQIRSRIDLSGENNPRWLGGISKNNYHYKLIQMQRYPEKHKARLKVYCAIRSGKIQRLPCEVCGAEKSEAHHHKGYENALDVIFLCRKHHIEAEKKIRERVN